MKKTSRVVRLRRMEPSAPWWSIAGPELTLIATPSSLAMMCASVVLPSPGGPHSRTWSAGSSRRLTGRSHRPVARDRRGAPHRLYRSHRVEPGLQLDDHLRCRPLSDAAGSPDRRRILAHDGALEHLEARRAQDVEPHLRPHAVDLDQHLEQLELLD